LFDASDIVVQGVLTANLKFGSKQTYQ